MPSSGKPLNPLSRDEVSVTFRVFSCANASCHMTTENEFQRIIRTVAASVQRALAGPGRPTEGQHTMPKLESRNGYGSPKAGDRSRRS
jgi:hypothetical protein